MGSMFLGNELSSTISSSALRRGGKALDAFLDGEYCWRLVEFVNIGAHSHRNNIHLAVFGCFLLVWAEWFQTVSRSRSAFLDEATKLCVWGMLESGSFPDWALRIPSLVFRLGRRCRLYFWGHFPRAVADLGIVFCGTRFILGVCDCKSCSSWRVWSSSLRRCVGQSMEGGWSIITGS